MAAVTEELTNPDTRSKYKHTGNWNRRIQIPGVWSGHVKDIPPDAVEELIKQGRKDFVPITPTSKEIKEKNSEQQGGRTDSTK